jgi:hypothetical protein
MRQKRGRKIMSLINECYEEHREVKILDIGGSRTYWKIIPESFLIEKKVSITVLNLPADKISNIISEKNDEIFTFHIGDGCYLVDFKDKAFHIAHSNSTIEHVGVWENKKKMSEEMQRVAEKVYLQTPNFWFPVEPHFITPFFHWLPAAVRIYFLKNFNLATFRKTSNYEAAQKRDLHNSLLTKKELKSLFPEAILLREKFMLLTKSWIVIKK